MREKLNGLKIIVMVLHVSCLFFFFAFLRCARLSLVRDSQREQPFSSSSLFRSLTIPRILICTHPFALIGSIIESPGVTENPYVLPLLCLFFQTTKEVFCSQCIVPQTIGTEALSFQLTIWFLLEFCACY